jgi:hypothetical protein
MSVRDLGWANCGHGVSQIATSDLGCTVYQTKQDSRIAAGLALATLLCLVGCGDDDQGQGLDDPSARAGAGHVQNGHSGGGLHSADGLPAGTPGTSQVLIRDSAQEPDGGDGTGAFRTTCEFSHMRYDDPIVFPGQDGASHLHVFFGNTQADASSTAQSLRDSGNSTCRGGIVNRSSYWVPALLDADGEPQVPETANFYYKSGYRGVDPESVRPFPKGLRMIAGDAAATGEQEVAYWSCGGDGQSATIPNCEEGSLLQMHVEFPQCWDGRNLDSDNHKSHMAYPRDGQCPSGHPQAIPAITFNIPYRVPDGGTRGFRLVSDSYSEAQPGGYSAHGDWFDGWDHEVVDVWVSNCINTGANCHSHLLGDGREIYYDDELVASE